MMVQDAPAGRPPLLQLRGLTVRFGSSPPVVEGIDLQIAAGECVGLVGESGSGKSVTARAILGLAGERSRVEASELTFDRRDLRRLRPAERRRLRGREVAYIPQAALTGLDPLRTVGREVADALRLHTDLSAGARAKRVIELLGEVDIPDPELRAAQHPWQLSGGLRQRALIASAIAAGPKLLIADEPTTALDRVVQQGILNLLESLRDRGIAILLISHDLSVVSRLSTRVAVMRAGRVVEAGETKAVLDAPQHPYTQQLVAAVPTGRPRGTRLAPALPIVAADTDNPRTAPHRSAESPLSVTPGGPRPSGDASGVSPTGVSTSPNPVLEAHHLTRRFGSRTAVDDITLTLTAGRTLGVVGESGSGKTTLARLLLALERPDEGEVTLDGAPWSIRSERERRALRPRIGAIYQDALSSFDPRLTVQHVLSDALTGGRSRRAPVGELLARVGLDPEVAAKRPRFLSGGQQQRVAIARALAPGPGILVCDEPVSSLDVSVQAQVLDLLDELQRQRGLAYLFISHDLGVVRHVSDDVLVMKGGRMLEQGPTETVFAAPQHPYTRTLLAAT